MKQVDGALAVESVHFSEHFISVLPTCWTHVVSGIDVLSVKKKSYMLNSD